MKNYARPNNKPKAVMATLFAVAVLLSWAHPKPVSAEGMPGCRGWDRGGCVRPQEMDNLPFEREDKTIDHYTFPEPLSLGEKMLLWEEIERNNQIYPND